MTKESNNYIRDNYNKNAQKRLAIRAFFFSHVYKKHDYRYTIVAFYKYAVTMIDL